MLGADNMFVLKRTTQHSHWWRGKGIPALWAGGVPWRFLEIGRGEGRQPDGGWEERALSLEDVWELGESQCNRDSEDKVGPGAVSGCAWSSSAGGISEHRGRGQSGSQVPNLGHAAMLWWGSATPSSRHALTRTLGRRGSSAGANGAQGDWNHVCNFASEPMWDGTQEPPETSGEQTVRECRVSALEGQELPVLGPQLSEAPHRTRQRLITRAKCVAPSVHRCVYRTAAVITVIVNELSWECLFSWTVAQFTSNFLLTSAWLPECHCPGLSFVGPTSRMQIEAHIL